MTALERTRGPVPAGKARYDCECGNIHYGSASASFICCPRCGETLRNDNPMKSRGGDRGSRVKPTIYGDQL